MRIAFAAAWASSGLKGTGWRMEDQRPTSSSSAIAAMKHRSNIRGADPANQRIAGLREPGSRHCDVIQLTGDGLFIDLTRSANRTATARYCCGDRVFAKTYLLNIKYDSRAMGSTSTAWAAMRPRTQVWSRPINSRLMR